MNKLTAMQIADMLTAKSSEEFKVETHESVVISRPWGEGTLWFEIGVDDNGVIFYTSGVTDHPGQRIPYGHYASYDVEQVEWSFEEWVGA